MSTSPVTTTTLACGHALISSADAGSPASSPRGSPDSQRRFLNDTCAICDPEARRRQVKKEYDRCHAWFMHEYIEAKKSGDKKGMKQWEELMMKNTLDTRERNFAASRVRRDPDVQFYLDDPTEDWVW